MCRYDQLRVVVHDDAAALATAAATQAAAVIERGLRAEGRVAIVLATGNSQLGLLAALTDVDLEWAKVTVLHMDEYIGLSESHPASFRRYLRDHVIRPLDGRGPAAFDGIRGDADDLAAEIARYEAVLRHQQPCLCVLGIGENGHLAFNDPPADLRTTALVHRVTLDRVCRQQQVGEGHFPDLAAVPREALTLTVPALLASPTVIGVVPERRKAAAVKAALEGPVTGDCPASALRHAPNATLHLDRQSASQLSFQRQPS